MNAALVGTQLKYELLQTDVGIPFDALEYTSAASMDARAVTLPEEGTAVHSSLNS